MQTFSKIVPTKFSAKKFDWTEDGDIITQQVGKLYPLPEQDLLAEELCKLLNRRYRFISGRWRVCLTNVKKEYYDNVVHLFKRYVPTEIEAILLDEDGDAKLKVVFDQNVWELIEVWGVTSMADLCEQAFTQYKDVTDPLEIRPEQQFRRAKGESPLSNQQFPDTLVN